MSVHSSGQSDSTPPWSTMPISSSFLSTKPAVQVNGPHFGLCPNMHFIGSVKDQQECECVLVLPVTRIFPFVCVPS